MTFAEDLLNALGVQGDAQGNLRIQDGHIQIKLDDGQFWNMADMFEFTHRHIKAINGWIDALGAAPFPHSS